MDKTYLDYFNFYLKQFLNEIISYFPQTKSKILLNYRNLLENNDNKNDLYVKYYMTKVNDHLVPISKKDEQLFENKILFFVEGVNFSEIWNSSDATDNNKNAIWKYLQLLTLLGRKCLPNKKDIVNMLEKVGGVIETPELMDKTLEKEVKDDEEPQDSSGLAGMLKGLGNLSNLGNLAGGEGGLDMKGLGEGFSAITKLASSLSEGLKNIDMNELSRQMEETMSQNVNENGNSENTKSENNSTTNSDDNRQENNSSESNSTGLTSSLFSDLAEEMANTFDFENDNNNEQPQNINEALGNFMKGDNPAKFMNLINKFSNKLQNDIQSGKLNQNDLLKETSKMMGNLDKNNINSEELQKQAEQMFGANSPQVNKIKNNTRGLAARERLRKKLNEKKNKK